MTDTEIQSAIQAGIAAAKVDTTIAQTWLQKHERLILVVLFLIGFVFLVNHLLNNWAARDQIQAQTATQQLNQQKANDTTLQAQAKAAQDQYQATVQALTQQNAQLAAAIQNRTVVVEQQQVKNASLPLPDLAVRWATLASIPQASLTATSDGITVDSHASLNTVNILETVKPLQDTVADQQTSITNLDTELTDETNYTTALKTQVTSLQTTVTDSDKACKAQLTLANAQAKKGKWKSFWMGVGVGAGAVGTAVIAALVH